MPTLPPTYASFNDYLKAHYQGPFMATDIVIRHDPSITHPSIAVPYTAQVVLIERKYFPFGLAPPGGMAERMTLDQNAVKEAREETGLHIIIDNIEQPLCVLSEPTQDPRAFIASVAYTASGYGHLMPDPKEDAKAAHLISLNRLEQLVQNPKIWAAPHHQRIYQLYLDYVKARI